MKIKEIRATMQALLSQYCEFSCTCPSDWSRKGHQDGCYASPQSPMVKKAQKAIQALYKLEAQS